MTNNKPLDLSTRVRTAIKRGKEQGIEDWDAALRQAAAWAARHLPTRIQRAVRYGRSSEHIAHPVGGVKAMLNTLSFIDGLTVKEGFGGTVIVSWEGQP